jgi:hypothetical protein
VGNSVLAIQYLDLDSLHAIQPVLDPGNEPFDTVIGCLWCKANLQSLVLRNWAKQGKRKLGPVEKQKMSSFGKGSAKHVLTGHNNL